MRNQIGIMALLCLMTMIVIGVNGCGIATDDAPTTGKSTMAEMTATEQGHQRLIKARPIPKMTDSLERKNLIKYLQYWNSDSRISYMYLLSRAGTVVGYYTIVGKITYCRSKLTTQDQLVEAPFHDSRNGAGGNITCRIESPGLDGSYGPSEDAIFFFTQENPDVPVVWKGDYLVSGVPMKINTTPVLGVREIK